MFSKWFKKGDHGAEADREKADSEKPGSSVSKASPSSSGEGGPNHPRKCPTCLTVFYHPDMVVCPNDRSMLLRESGPGHWLDELRCVTIKECPACRRQFSQEYIAHCPDDNTPLQCILSSIDRELPVIEQRFEVSTYRGRDKLFDYYGARDIESDTKVTIRFLRYEQTSDEKTVSRLLTSARAAIGLSHPNIVELLSANVLPNGVPYLVTQRVAGRTLGSELSREGPLSEQTAVGVLIDVLEGLQFAHEKGIVHGGISPFNLIHSPDDSNPRGCIADFGVAERMFRQLDWEGVSTETHTANMYGEPDGICPEFCKGKRPTPASDIYQVGCALYQLLSGYPPFERENVTAVLFAHMTDKPDDLKKQRPDLSNAMIEIIYKCLEKEPSDRYASARELANALACLVWRPAET